MSLVDPRLPANPLAVTAAGIPIWLDVAAVAPARLEVSTASLTLVGSATQDPVALNIASDAVNAVWTNSHGNTVSWISVDWGASRVLTGVLVKAATATSTNVGRIKIADGGAWYPPAPRDTLTFGVLLTLPGVVASRLLVEITEGGADRTPTTESLTAVTLTFAAGDLALAVGGAGPCWERAGQLLPGGQVVAGGDALVAALNAAIPADGAGGRIELSLRAGLTGSVDVKQVAVTATKLMASLDPPYAANTLPLRWTDATSASVALDTNASLQEIRFTMKAEVAAERLVLTPPVAVVRSDAPLVVHAQLVDPGHSAAQGLPPLPSAAITGVEVFVRATVAPVAGAVALHPDAGGRPAAAPFAGAVVPFTLAAADKVAWLPCLFETPLRIEGAAWIVITVRAGELVWPLADTGPAVDNTPSPSARHRIGDGPWLARTLPESPAPWAICRVRGTAPPPAVALSVRVERGAASNPPSLTLRPDARGVVEVSEEGLVTLNQSTTGRLRFTVVADPPAAGTVTLEHLRIRYA